MRKEIYGFIALIAFSIAVSGWHGPTSHHHDLYGVASLALVPMEPAQEIMPIRFDGHGVTVVHSDVTIKGHTPEVVSRCNSPGMI